MAEGRRGPQALSVRLVDAPPSVVEATRRPAEELHGVIEDMIALLETKVQPDLRRGRYPDRRNCKLAGRSSGRWGATSTADGAAAAPLVRGRRASASVRESSVSVRRVSASVRRVGSGTGRSGGTSAFLACSAPNCRAPGTRVRRLLVDPRGRAELLHLCGEQAVGRLGQREGVVVFLLREHGAAGVELLAAGVAVAEHDVPGRGDTSSGTPTCRVRPAGPASSHGGAGSALQSVSLRSQYWAGRAVTVVPAALRVTWGGSAPQPAASRRTAARIRRREVTVRRKPGVLGG